MKNLSIKITVITSLVLVVSGCSLGGNQIYPYKFDTAKIEYEVKGTFDGNLTKYIKGDVAKHETVLKSLDGDKSKDINSIIIEDKEMLYQIDMITKTGSKSENIIYKQLKDLPKEEREQFLINLATGISDDQKTQKPKGQKTIAGENCDLYDIQNAGEVCLWNGIPLYSSMTDPVSGVKNTNTATSIQLDVDIQSAVFNVPEGVTMKD